MPFTFSHPAAVIPLRNKQLVFSALVVGSMTPDFEYFLRLSTSSRSWHTFPGLFLYGLPFGLLILWIFHAILKRPLMGLLPVSHRKRLLPFAGTFDFFPAGRFASILLSLGIGMGTHLGWDAMTHHNGWFVENYGFLSQTVFVTPYKPIQLFSLLQHFSTIFGAAFMAICYFQWIYRTPEISTPEAEELEESQTRLGALLLVMPFVAGYFYVYGFKHHQLIVLPSWRNLETFKDLAVYCLMTSIVLLFIELVIYSLASELNLFPKRRRAPALSRSNQEDGSPFGG